VAAGCWLLASVLARVVAHARAGARTQDQARAPERAPRIMMMMDVWMVQSWRSQEHPTKPVLSAQCPSTLLRWLAIASSYWTPTLCGCGILPVRTVVPTQHTQLLTTYRHEL
jgi:hypothetical protein